MKFCRYCNRTLPPSAFSARRASPDGLAYKCRECSIAYKASRDPEHYRRLRKANYEKNRAYEVEKALAYYRQNRDRLMRQHAEYMRATAEKQRRYREENLPIIVANTARYRAAKALRVPPWLTDEDHYKISMMYEAARQISEDTGVPHHVDHKVPLRGEFVSGLHVPWNLQVMPGKENVSKRNKHV